jgi:hypothetical protein
VRFFIWGDDMKHYKGKILIRDKELINLIEERDEIKPGTEVIYKQYIYKVKKIKGNRAIWDRVSKCDRCEWSKWTGKYYCLFPKCIK